MSGLSKSSIIPMMAPQIPHAFIVRTQQQPSRRDEELLNAYARSHASRVSRLRVKTLCGQTKDPEMLTPPLDAGASRLSHPTQRFAAIEALTIHGRPRFGAESRRSSNPKTSNADVERTKGHDRYELIVNSRSPLHWSKGFRVDPFSCIPYVSDAFGELDLLTHFTFPVLGSMMESLGQTPQRVSSYYARLLLVEVARHEDFFHILLACITATIYQRGVVNPHDFIGQRILRHKIRGISLLRRRLLQPGALVDDGVLLSIIELSHLEILNKNRPAALLHRRRVHEMITERGGISSPAIPAGIRALLELYMIWKPECELIRLEDPLCFPPPPETRSKAIAKLPLGFQELAHRGKLTRSMIDLLLKTTAGVDPFLDAERHGRDVNVETTLTSLAHTYPALAAASDANGPALEKLICLVLMRTRVGVAIIPAFRSPTCMSHSITLELTDTIPRRSISYSSDERECLLWIWLMTLECWCAGSLSAEQWDFEMLGRRFLWTPHLSNVLRRHRFPDPSSTWSRASSLAGDHTVSSGAGLLHHLYFSGEQLRTA